MAHPPPSRTHEIWLAEALDRTFGPQPTELSIQLARSFGLYNLWQRDGMLTVVTDRVLTERVSIELLHTLDVRLPIGSHAAIRMAEGMVRHYSTEIRNVRPGHLPDATLRAWLRSARR